jgi:hypothetical protein
MLTLVRLVYLLEPTLGLLRARRIGAAAAAGDLVRVPPLRRRQRKYMSCSASTRGPMAYIHQSDCLLCYRLQPAGSRSVRYSSTHHGEAVVGGADLGGGGARLHAEHRVVRLTVMRLHPLPPPPAPHVVVACVACVSIQTE